jgi:hypothetical protein
MGAQQIERDHPGRALAGLDDKRTYRLYREEGLSIRPKVPS